MRYFTQSELKTWRRCKRKWWLGTYRRLKLDPTLTKPGAASQGTLVHASLEGLYTTGDWEEPLTEALSHAQTIWAEQPERLEKYEKMVELAYIMVEGYIDWLAESGADQHFTLIDVERKVAVPLPGHENVGLMGKLDQLIHDDFFDQIAFLDFKSVGGLDDIPKKAERDEQFLHYTTLLRLRDPETKPTAGVWRMLRKVKRTARATPPFYGEHRYHFNRHQLDSYYARMTVVINEILHAEQLLAASLPSMHHILMYPTPDRDCDYFCEFKDICPMFDNGDRVEQLIEDWYVEGDPLERYSEKEGDE